MRVWLKDGEKPGMVKGQISFGRLVEQLRRAGEFRADEIVTDLSIENGMVIYGLRAKED